ncbi:MAG: hypothetical protein A2516_09310 [Alphaproteobacteria bacterium RIFOXYD12_FULL_60_8]|nr:MAG: hypothetical protein A2516_09310 [Alphaproteobacteria bacterium RIFOXYD12_FULL_60_8]
MTQPSAVKLSDDAHILRGINVQIKAGETAGPERSIWGEKGHKKIPSPLWGEGQGEGALSPPLQVP